MVDTSKPSVLYVAGHCANVIAIMLPPSTVSIDIFCHAGGNSLVTTFRKHRVTLMLDETINTYHP